MQFLDEEEQDKETTDYTALAVARNPKTEDGRRKTEDSLGLGSGAYQGPWSSVASAPT